MSLTLLPPASLAQEIELAARRLGHVTDDPRAEARRLWAEVLGVSLAGLVAREPQPPSPQQRQHADTLIARRALGEPFAYLLGRQGFWTLDLAVSPEVLIPRPDTEALVEWALDLLPMDRAQSVADLGTGSGAIALAIASERPLARVIASDASEAALRIAAANALALGLRERVEFRLGNWCAALLPGLFDLIVSNPPYIAEGDPHLADLGFEPQAALVSGDDGLDAICAILCETPAFLRRGGALLIEHGAEQGAIVRQLMTAAGFHEVATRRDLGGRERVTAGVR